MTSIDLNCDMGEGMGNDALIMPFISSANIACGAHAGDDDTMKRTIELALEHKVAIGAHPSFNDKAHFGRKEMNVPEEQLYDLITIQIDRLATIAGTFGAALHHVKPHGALYNMAAKDEVTSRIIARAVKASGANLVLYGLSKSHLISEARNTGLRTASEVFADRTYNVDGSLKSRSEPGAMIDDEQQSLDQVLKMVLKKEVTAITGEIIAIDVETVCIHGDGKHAPLFAKKINETLQRKGIAIITI